MKRSADLSTNKLMACECRVVATLHRIYTHTHTHTDWYNGRQYEYNMDVITAVCLSGDVVIKRWREKKLRAQKKKINNNVSRLGEGIDYTTRARYGTSLTTHTDRRKPLCCMRARPNVNSNCYYCLEHTWAMITYIRSVGWLCGARAL